MEKYIVSQEWTSSKAGTTGKSYYMGLISIPMFGDQLQTSSRIADAKLFDSTAEAQKVLSEMGKNAKIEILPS